ncbi:MAG: sensor histidine kinase [Promethearchaeota archaeon]|jgi:PAS domain S-box-containing protein
MSDESNQSSQRKVNSEVIEILILFIALVLICITRLYDYLLFHSIAEIFSIVIAGGVFFVGWNSRKYMKNSFFLILGISSLFIAVIDLIHTLSYDQMNIFLNFDANLPTSLWIAARYLQAGSILFASFLLRRSIKPLYLGITYLGILHILFFLIFFNLFPVSYIVGEGLTPFKIISEYIIILILLGAFLVIIKNRTEFDKRVFSLIIISILMTIFAELAFTIYSQVTDIPNLVGHLFKIIAFYFLYKAIIQIGIKDPFDLLFRKISRSELELRNIIEHSGAGITMLDENGRYLLVNEKAAVELGGKPEDFVGKSLYDVFPSKLAEEYFNSNRELIKSGINRAYQRSFDLPSGKKTFWIVEQPLKNIDEKHSSLLSLATDITERIQSERLLEEAELRYRTTFEQSPDGIIILDLDTFKAIEFNDAVCKILGYTRKEFAQLRINDYDAIENPFETRKHIDKILKEGRDDFETKFRTKSGNIKDILVTAKVITLSKKRYFQSIFRDITERKSAVEAIRKREYDLNERVKELTCLYNISKLLEQSDISIEEVLEKTLSFLPPAWQYPGITCARILYKGQEFKTENYRDTKWNQKTNIREYGKIVGSIEIFYLKKMIELDEGPFLKEERLLINGISEMLSTFIERKISEEKIFNLSKFPSENPNPVLRVGNQQVIYSNKIGKTLFNVTEGNSIPKVLEEPIINVLSNNKIEELELRLNSRMYTLAITPVENMDYVNVYGLDITERKKAEQRLSQLISTVSHELRTPITVLLMSIEYLTKNKDTLSEGLEEKLMDGISRNIQLLNKLAEDILLLSRIDEKRLEIERKEYKPLEIINEILTLMEPIGKEKNIDFEVDVNNEIHLRGDPKRIDQIFRIIIDNAIKYSEENSKIQIISSDNYQGVYNPNKSSGILFQFKDFGRGIPKEDLPNIFDRFFRSSNVNEIAGTGLGLAIAKDLTEAHQGHIFVESELGKGTTLILFLPQIE